MAARYSGKHTRVLLGDQDITNAVYSISTCHKVDELRTAIVVLYLERIDTDDEGNTVIRLLGPRKDSNG